MASASIADNAPKMRSDARAQKVYPPCASLCGSAPNPPSWVWQEAMWRGIAGDSSGLLASFSYRRRRHRAIPAGSTAPGCSTRRGHRPPRRRTRCRHDPSQEMSLPTANVGGDAHGLVAQRQSSESTPVWSRPPAVLLRSACADATPFFVPPCFAEESKNKDVRR